MNAVEISLVRAARSRSVSFTRGRRISTTELKATQRRRFVLSVFQRTSLGFPAFRLRGLIVERQKKANNLQ